MASRIAEVALLLRGGFRPGVAGSSSAASKECAGSRSSLRGMRRREGSFYSAQGSQSTTDTMRRFHRINAVSLPDRAFAHAIHAHTSRQSRSQSGHRRSTLPPFTVTVSQPFSHRVPAHRLAELRCVDPEASYHLVAHTHSERRRTTQSNSQAVILLRPVPPDLKSAAQPPPRYCFSTAL